MTSDHLTAESFRAAFDRMIEKGDQEQRERGERSREITARGRYKSVFGQIVDQAYVNGGPLIMNPWSLTMFEEFLAAEEARAAAGEPELLTEDEAIRIQLAAWSAS